MFVTKAPGTIVTIVNNLLWLTCNAHNLNAMIRRWTTMYVFKVPKVDETEFHSSHIQWSPRALTWCRSNPDLPIHTISSRTQASGRIPWVQASPHFHTMACCNQLGMLLVRDQLGVSQYGKCMGCRKRAGSDKEGGTEGGRGTRTLQNSVCRENWWNKKEDHLFQAPVPSFW